jgi:hypothetical protein
MRLFGQFLEGSFSETHRPFFTDSVGSGLCSTCNHLCAYTLSKGRMVHNLIYDHGKEESDEPADIFTDRRYRHHRVGLRLTHPVVGVDASLGRLYTMG